MPSFFSSSTLTIHRGKALRLSSYLKPALAVAFAISQGALASISEPTARVTLDSVKTDGSVIVRSDLTPEESAAIQPAVITLSLRNKDELAARVNAGDLVTPEEMAERYYPTHDQWQKVASWAQCQGLAVDPENITHMSVKASGNIAQMAAAFQTSFARVLWGDGREYSAAILAPSVPKDLGPLVTGVLRLQPQFQPRPQTNYTPVATNDTYGPQYLLDAYGATNVGDGTGQIIAIFGGNSPPSSTDLTAYWAKIGSTHTMADVTVVNPNGYPAYIDSNSGVVLAGSWGAEDTMDTEIVSGLCPKAQFRIYCIDGSYASAAEAVLADLKDFPGIHQFTVSGGGPEEAATSQYFMALAAQGVTTFASSGDAGSNFTTANGTENYSASAPLAVNYPASDPYVTGVGGTAQFAPYANSMDPSQGISGVTKEVAWSEGTSPVYILNTLVYGGSNPPGGTPTVITYAGGYSGGGISSVFSRPSWQTGPGVPAGTMRCVPDVAAVASGGPVLYGYFDGDSGCGGTSESAPIWAALCAILNQSLLSTGHSAVGLLGPKVYPLAGTGAMNYIPQGYVTYVYEDDTSNPLPPGAVDTNGAYAVGPTYDCITGVGYPNVAQIAAALEAPPAGLSVHVSTPLPSGPVTNGSLPITLQAVATGSPTSYQWELNGVPIAGATGATEVVYPTAANEGDYSVVVTNSAGSASTDAGTLTVTTNAWIINLSARAYAETGANLLIAGFVTAGPDQKSVLVRGDGPSLIPAPFGITNALTDPQLSLFKSGITAPLATTSGWASTLSAEFAQLGAFPFAAGSHDTALLQTLGPGPYTAQVISATTNSGVALAEIYDADGLAPTDRLANISARAFVGTGGNILIGGFVINGSTPQTIIIRGDGPTLGLAPFNVPGVLANPVLTLFTASGAVIASNTGWGNAPTAGSGATSGMVIQPLTSAVAAKVGAFTLANGSADSALVVTLPPGNYTAQIAGSNGLTGVALVEIYELR